jgi:hypothetical protein
MNEKLLRLVLKIVDLYVETEFVSHEKLLRLVLKIVTEILFHNHYV